MARLTPQKREDIKNALMLGDSQYKVSQDLEVSSATVNKIFKTLPTEELEKVKGLVKEEVSIQTVLSEQSESLVKAFDAKVNDEVRRKNLVFGVAEKLVRQIDTAISTPTKAIEYDIDGNEVEVEMGIDSKSAKEYMDAIDKASITLNVNQRHANSQINVNTQNNQSNTVEIALSEEEAKSKALALGVPLSALM